MSGSAMVSGVAWFSGSFWAWLFFFVDLAADLALAGAFEDDLRLAAGFGVVSASCDAGEVSDCAIVGAAVSDSIVAWEIAPLSGSS